MVSSWTKSSAVNRRDWTHHQPLPQEVPWQRSLVYVRSPFVHVLVPPRSVSFFGCCRPPCPRPSRATFHVSQKVREGRLCARMWRRDRHSGGVGTGGRAECRFSRSEQVTLHRSRVYFLSIVSPTRVFLCVLVAQKNTVILSFVTRLRLFYRNL